MKIKTIYLLLLIVCLLCGCNKVQFIDDGNGHKQIKDKNGNFVKTEWIDLNGKWYYFDRNGYLVTNQWIDNEYYADENGMMKTNYWYEGENGYYYLDNDGKYLRNTIKEIDGNFYAFDLNGVNIKNAPFVVNGEGYYFGNDGKADEKEGWKNFLDTYCYVKDDGHLLISDWQDENGKRYYFNEIGLMVKNSFVDGNYYVDENGEMVKNKRIKKGQQTYYFDNDGAGSIVVLKQKSGMWQFYESKKSGTTYIYSTLRQAKGLIECGGRITISSNNDILINFQYTDGSGRIMGGFDNTTEISLEVNGKTIISSERIKKTTSSEDLYLTEKQCNILKEYLLKDGNVINIKVINDWGKYIGNIELSFDVSTTGFKEVYLNF